MSQFTYCSSANPCEVCGARSGDCRSTHDGLRFCKNRHGGDYAPGFVYLKESRNGVWGLYKPEDADIDLSAIDRPLPALPPPSPKRPPRVIGPNDWTVARHIERNACPMLAEDAHDLAASLRLPVDALDALPILFLRNDSHNAYAWVFPEYDGTGTLSCRVLRYPDGRKIAHGPRGLTIPKGWKDCLGPLFIPEGASDVLTISMLGLAAVGRPNNAGGVEQLAQLLANLPDDRRIIVLGENDRKTGDDSRERWPGRDGAETVASQLAERLGRPVVAVLPPDGAKDVRDWYTKQLVGTRLREAFLTAFDRPDPSPNRQIPNNEPRATPQARVNTPDATAHAAAESIRLERLASFRCIRRRRIILERKSDGAPFILDRRCESWGCPGCSHLHKDQWKDHIRGKLTAIGNPTVNTGAINLADWPTVARSLHRNKAKYFRLAIANDQVFVVATRPFHGSLPLNPREAADQLCNQLDRVYAERRPISSSRTWKLPVPDDEEKKASKFTRKGCIPHATSEQTIRDILSTVQAIQEDVDLNRSTQQQYTILRFRSVSRQCGWTEDARQHLYFCLNEGEAYPFVSDADFQSAMRQRVGGSESALDPCGFTVNLGGDP